MKIPNDIHSIERLFVKKSYSYYDGLKHVIKKADLVNKEIFLEKIKPYNGIFGLTAQISKKTVFCNITSIDFSNSDNYEIQRKIQTGFYKNVQARKKHKIIDLVYEQEQFTSVLEKQFIKCGKKTSKIVLISNIEESRMQIYCVNLHGKSEILLGTLKLI